MFKLQFTNFFNKRFFYLGVIMTHFIHLLHKLIQYKPEQLKTSFTCFDKISKILIVISIIRTNPSSSVFNILSLFCTVRSTVNVKWLYSTVLFSSGFGTRSTSCRWWYSWNFPSGQFYPFPGFLSTAAVLLLF